MAGVGGSGFEVPHDERQEAAGQDQQQRVKAVWQTVSWQRAWSGATMSHLAGYHRTGSSLLNGTAADTPLAVAADRAIRRVGFLASASHAVGGHLFKVGAEAAQLHLREQFAFSVTDADGGDFTPEVLAFTPESPFAFVDRGTPTLVALYAQDSFRPLDAVTVDLGVRVDWSRMLVVRVTGESAPRRGLSPRPHRHDCPCVVRQILPTAAVRESSARLVGAGVRAVAVCGRRRDGGAPLLEPERQSALEVAVDQMLGRLVRLDVAYWRRWVRNVADPNVFLGTTIIFPNSVARGWASGVDVRVDVPRVRGWSAFVSYGHSRVEQAGPITGGLFLEDEVAEIAGGERFTPDHDQRHTGAAGISFVAGGTSLAVNGRYESGTPLQVGDDDLDELEERPGAELVDFERGRVKPRTTWTSRCRSRFVVSAAAT